MTEYEAALELLKMILRIEPEAQTDKAKILALYRECLAAARGKAE